MESEFTSKKLNTAGVDKVIGVADAFTQFHAHLKKFMPRESGQREAAIVLTKLQEASMWANKAISTDTRYHMEE